MSAIFLVCVVGLQQGDAEKECVLMHTVEETTVSLRFNPGRSHMWIFTAKEVIYCFDSKSPTMAMLEAPSGDKERLCKQEWFIFP